MKAAGNIIAAPLKALGLIKTPGKAPKPMRAITRDDARAAAERDDELRRRRGGAADIVTGLGGAEPAAAGGKETLGS